MNSLLKYFDAAYLINLPERTDRLKSAVTELASIGWTLGPGAVQLYPARRFTDAAGFPSPASRGCFNSHMDCIRTAQRSGKKNVLIIEDDISFALSIPRLTASIISQLESTPWGFVYLGHEGTGDIANANARTTEVSLVPAPHVIQTTHFYGIDSRIFGKLLDHLDRIASGSDREVGRMSFDGAYAVFRRRNPDVQVLIANPKLGWQRPSRSDSHPQFFDRIKLLRPAGDALRNLKYMASRWRS